MPIVINHHIGLLDLNVVVVVDDDDVVVDVVAPAAVALPVRLLIVQMTVETVLITVSPHCATGLVLFYKRLLDTRLTEFNVT